MSPISRRTLLKGAAAGALALALPSLHSDAQAATPQLQWLEAQSWWNGPVGGGQPNTMGFPFRHIHFSVGIPVTTVSGIVSVPYQCFTHGQIGYLKQVKWQDDIGGAAQTIIHEPNVIIGPNSTFTGVFNIDTSKEMNSGWRLWRFYAEWIHENGNQHVARPRFRVQVANGKGRKDVSTAEGPTGWYREKGGMDWGYVNAGLKFEDRIALNIPKSGTWTPKVVINRNDPGGAPPLSGWSIHLDPDMHSGNQGKILKAGTGSLSGKVALSLAGVSAGPHKLVLRGFQVANGKRHEGVGAYSFLVG